MAALLHCSSLHLNRLCLSARSELAVVAPFCLFIRSYGVKHKHKPWKQKPNRSARLKLILTKDVPNLGGKSQLVEVKHGYGRNYLLPNKKAVYATPYNIVKFGVTEEEVKGSKVVSRTDSVQFVSNYLSGKTLTVRQDPEQYKWYVYKSDVSRAFYSSLQLHVPINCIVMEKPITEFISTQVQVQLSDKVTISVDVTVVEHVDSEVQRKRDKRAARQSGAQ